MAFFLGGLALAFALAGLVTLLGATIAFRKSVFDRFGPLHGHAEDNVLTLRGALLGHGRCLPQALVVYRQSPDSLGQWLFARGDKDAGAMRRRYERTIFMYRTIADDLQRAIAALPDAEPERLRLARSVAEMYRIEADAREAILDRARTVASGGRGVWWRPAGSDRDHHHRCSRAGLAAEDLGSGYGRR